MLDTYSRLRTEVAYGDVVAGGAHIAPVDVRDALAVADHVAGDGAAVERRFPADEHRVRLNHARPH